MSRFNVSPFTRERGSVLLVTMVFLLIFGVVAASIFRGSQTSVQAIGNMQWRTQAIDAANLRIAELLSTPTVLNTALSTNTLPPDDLIDGINVSVEELECTLSAEVDKDSLDPDNPQDVACINSELLLGGSFCADVEFSLVVLASDPATGANVRVEQGAAARVVGASICN